MMQTLPRRQAAAILVPQQPAIKTGMRNYHERVLIWNPLSKKNFAHFYQFDTGPAESILQLIPDNCIDFMFCCGQEQEAFIFGPRLFQTDLVLKPNTTYFFFKPYSLTGARKMKINFSDLAGSSTKFDKQFDDLSIVEQIGNASSFRERISHFLRFTRKFLINRSYTPGVVENLELLVCRSKGSVRVEQLAESTGYTSRYCRRLFRDMHGISIKGYSDILRFQNIVRMLLESGGTSIADIIFENNLYDQSHLIHELKKYTGYTPDNFYRQFYA